MRNLYIVGQGRFEGPFTPEEIGAAVRAGALDPEAEIREDLMICYRARAFAAAGLPPPPPPPVASSFVDDLLKAVFAGAVVYLGAKAVSGLLGAPSRSRAPTRPRARLESWGEAEERMEPSLRRRFPGAEVLAQPSYQAPDGTRRRPDAVVLGKSMLHVAERKHVETLRPTHVRQAAEYMDHLGATSGEVRVSAHTEVSTRVRQLAGALGVRISRAR